MRDQAEAIKTCDIDAQPSTSNADDDQRVHEPSGDDSQDEEEMDQARRGRGTQSVERMLEHARRAGNLVGSSMVFVMLLQCGTHPLDSGTTRGFGCSLEA